MLLRLLARRDFPHQLGRALLDALLQRGGQLGQRRTLGGELRQQGLALDLGGLARGDVGADADQRSEAAIRLAHRPRAHVDPVLRAIGPDVAVFDLVVAAGFDRFIQHGEPARAIIGMHRRQQILIGKRLARLVSEKRLAGVGRL